MYMEMAKYSESPYESMLLCYTVVHLPMILMNICYFAISMYIYHKLSEYPYLILCEIETQRNVVLRSWKISTPPVLKPK